MFHILSSKKIEKSKKAHQAKLWSVVLSVTCASLLNESLYKKILSKTTKIRISNLDFWIFGF